MTLFYCFFISLLLVLIFMPVFIKLSSKYEIFDVSGGRKIHKNKKNNLGGVVIFFGFLISYIFALPSITRGVSIELALYYINVILCIVIVGIMDDLNPLRARNKLLIEVAFILFFCKMGLRLDNFYGFLGFYETSIWFSYIGTIFFYIVVINTFNLIDGIDGQASVIALAVFIPILIFFSFLVPDGYCKNCFGNVFFWSSVCVSIIGAILGFLHFNWEPSRIFMGDTGSLSIGMILASVMIAAIQYNGSYGSDINILGFEIKSKIGVIVLLFFIPLADTLRVFCARIKKGKSPFNPDKSHIHHLLIRTGACHQTSTLITLTSSIFISIIGIILSTIFTDNIFIPLMIVLFILYFRAIIYFTKFRIKGMNKKRICHSLHNEN